MIKIDNHNVRYFQLNIRLQNDIIKKNIIVNHCNWEMNTGIIHELTACNMTKSLNTVNKRHNYPIQHPSVTGMTNTEQTE